MKVIRRSYLMFIILFGYFVLIWACYSLTADTFKFWKYGVEKNAQVIALDHTSSGTKGTTTYYYELSLDGKRLIKDFRKKLNLGKTVMVLTLPNDKKKVTLGNENSGLFEIFSNSIGGDFMAVLVLGVFIFLFFAGPSTLIILLKNRHQPIE